MENQQEEYARSGVLGGVASVLNFGGSVLVYAYDVTAGAFGKVFSVVKKTPVVPGKAFNMVADSFGILKPNEIKKTQEKIKVYEKKIKNLYYQIGKEGATSSDHEGALETEPVKKLIADVREYEKEIQRLQNHIVEIGEQKKEEALRRKTRRKAVPSTEKKKAVDVEKVKKAVESVIAKSVRQGEFATKSEMEIFDKVANDLLDNEMEIKVLAAAELGKIGNDAAVPILMEASKFDDSDLISEIVNSLILLGDLRAVSMFKEKAADPNYRVRMGSIRGLYKMAEDKDAMPIITNALRDEHKEVRRSAATFIGWRDYADSVPALVQCLRDEDAGVRRAAVSAIANIKDESAVLPLINVLGDKDIEIRDKALEAVRVITAEEITFDVNASGSELKKAISNLRDWWQKERISKAEIAEVEEVEEVAAEVEAGEEVEEAEEAAAEVEAEEEVETEDAAEEAEEEEEPEFTEEKLMKMLKADLLSTCEELGIECNENMTKTEITRLILGRNE